MGQSIPDDIERHHILAAIARYDAGEQHQFADSTVYDILHDGRRYPPKAIVGMAAELMTGSPFGPADFKGGQESKCFKILQLNGFQIVDKTPVDAPVVWIFQANPNDYKIDEYLATCRYIYWKAPKYGKQFRIGDSCIIWRSGPNAGAIAIGRVVEITIPKHSVKFPECLGDEFWLNGSDPPETPKVGIEIDEVRLDSEAGFVPRSVFVGNPILAATTIVRMPNQTVFKLDAHEAKEAFSYWNTQFSASQSDVPAELEGNRRLRQHYARERSQYLVRLKKEQFCAANGGTVFCEICRLDFSVYYPKSLGDGFIEVHHLAPLFLQDQPRKTTLDDLLLVCSNCHRMIHRTKDVDSNLQLLRKHFSKKT